MLNTHRACSVQHSTKCAGKTQTDDLCKPLAACAARLAPLNGVHARGRAQQDKAHMLVRFSSFFFWIFFSSRAILFSDFWTTRLMSVARFSSLSKASCLRASTCQVEAPRSQLHARHNNAAPFSGVKLFANGCSDGHLSRILRRRTVQSQNLSH